MKKVIIIFLGLAAYAGIAQLISCTKRGGRHPNVILITIDTLVPNRLKFEGHTRNTSPAIDAFASEGVVFENSYSSAGWTLPAIASILTGRYPGDHGATDFHWPLDENILTMAGILRNAGYDTRGYVSHVVLQPMFGIANGFASYDYSVIKYGHPHDVSTAGQLTDLVTREMRTVEEPFFLWVHYFDPHFEYLRHAGWTGFGNSDIDRYDQEIAYTDFQISRLFRYLKKKRYYDDAIIILTSDHGEEFGEHGGVFHYTLHEEVMRVPLIIKALGIGHSVKLAAAEQIDILPTVLSLAGIEVEAVLPGRNLLAETSSARPVFMERDRPPPYRQRGVLLDHYKLIVVEMADTAAIPPESRGTYVKVTNVKPGIYLYDLSKDPNERKNLYSVSNPKAVELLGLLDEHSRKERNKSREIKIDEKLNEKLKSLGYIR